MKPRTSLRCDSAHTIGFQTDKLRTGALTCPQPGYSGDKFLLPRIHSNNRSESLSRFFVETAGQFGQMHVVPVFHRAN